MEQAVIVDCIRTPMGRSKGGVFKHRRAEDLSAHLMKGILERNPQVASWSPLTIFIGAVCNKRLEQGFNVARNAALLGWYSSLSASSDRKPFMWLINASSA